MNPTLPYWLAAAALPCGSHYVKQWLEHFTDIEQFFRASRADWQTIGVPEKCQEALQHPNWKAIEHAIAWSQAASHRYIVTFQEDDYPALLKELYDPPLVLYVMGDKTALSKRQVAIVGARHASAVGIQLAEQFAYQLAQRGLAITSGLARGIDGASHAGALRAEGITIGVCGTGLHHVYPPSHRPLAEKIIQTNGALISELPLSMPPRAIHFPRRNRIIAGLSRGVLVVEAALKSGSLITARLATEQGRDVFAIPHGIHHPLAKGCHALIRQGAKLVETVDDILEEWGMPPVQKQQAPAPARSIAAPLLCPESHHFLQYIGCDVTPIDAIILHSGLTAGKVSSMLLTLELEGYIQSVAGGYIRTDPNS